MGNMIIHIPDEEFTSKFNKKKEEPALSDIRVDAHVDLPYYMMTNHLDIPLSQLNQGPFTLNQAKEKGIRLFCTALYCEDSHNGEASFGRYQEIMGFFLKYFDSTKIITDKTHLKALRENTGMVGTILLLENADLLADGHGALDQIQEDGIKIVGLTHRVNNRLADGNDVPFAQGLTHMGREILRLLQKEGFIIDVAHLHPKSFWQALDLMERPFICSHTGIRNVYDIPRNLDLDQIKEIVDRRGIIGITFNPEMLGDNRFVEVEKIFEHLDVVVQRFGPDSIGIGSDMGGFEKCVGDMEDIRGIDKLIEKMDRHGYGQEAISRILGQNWFQFFENNL